MVGERRVSLVNWTIVGWEEPFNSVLEATLTGCGSRGVGRQWTGRVCRVGRGYEGTCMAWIWWAGLCFPTGVEHRKGFFCAPRNLCPLMINPSVVVFRSALPRNAMRAVVVLLLWKRVSSCCCHGYGLCLQVFSRDPRWRNFCLAHLFTHQPFEGGVLGLAYIGSPRTYSVGGICSPGMCACVRVCVRVCVCV